MANFEEAQQVVDISLKKIAAWQSKRSSGTDLYRNLLLASVLLKAHHACSESALANLDDHVTSSLTDDDRAASLLTDDDDGVVVTLGDFSSGVENSSLNAEVHNMDPVQSFEVIPNQALDEWEFFGPSGKLPDAGSSAKLKNASNEDIEEMPADIRDDYRETSDLPKATNSFSKKRRLEMDESVNEVEFKRQKTDCSLENDRFCMDFDDLISSMEDDCTLATAGNPDTSNIFADPSVDSLEQSICYPGRNYLEDLDCSADFLFSC